LNYPDLAKACGVKLEKPSWANKNYMQVRACFVPRPVDGKPGTDRIYLWWGAGKMELYEEQCHARLGRSHNACYPNYAQWGKTIETACPGWVSENKKRYDAAKQRRKLGI